MRKIFKSSKAFLVFYAITLSFIFLFYGLIKNKITSEAIVAVCGVVSTALGIYQYVNVWQDKIFNGQK